MKTLSDTFLSVAKSAVETLFSMSGEPLQEADAAFDVAVAYVQNFFASGNDEPTNSM